MGNRAHKSAKRLARRRAAFDNIPPALTHGPGSRPGSKKMRRMGNAGHDVHRPGSNKK